MRSRSGVLLALLGLVALVLAGCGGGDDTTQSGGTTTISMQDYRFSPESITIPAGEQVTLEFVNEGSITHEFMAGREVMQQGSSPHGFRQDLFEGVDVTVEPLSARATENMGAATPAGEDGNEAASGGQTPATGHGHAEGTEHAHDRATEAARAAQTEGGHAGGGGHHGFMIVAEPGETVSITFTLPPERAGEWTMGCFEESGLHYQQGMEGTITVTQ